MDYALEPPIGLEDVLRQLPVDVLRTSLWKRLADDYDEAFEHPETPSWWTGRDLRLVSRRLLAVADLMTQRCHIQWGLDSPDAIDGDEVPVVSEAEHQVLRGKFLARQECLHELWVGTMNLLDEGPALSTLQQGSAACRHVRDLQLSLEAFTPAFGEAVGQLFCNLRVLQLYVGFDEEPQVHSEFFRPLRHCPLLTEVLLSSSALDCGEPLRTLAALPTLRVLSVSGTLHGKDVPLLAALTGLCELSAEDLTVKADATCTPPDSAALRLGTALGSLTHLTHLRVPQWRSCTGSGASEYLDLVLGQLSGLQCLSVLRAGSPFAPQAQVACGVQSVRQLSCLTMLSCPSWQLYARAGHLPLLQHLVIEGHLTGKSLLATLQPLLPLPRLRRFGCEVHERDDDSAADRQAAVDALVGAAAALAKAPRLHHMDVRTSTVAWPEQPSVLAMALLLPVLRQLTALTLRGLSRTARASEWSSLCQATRLTSLQLVSCYLIVPGIVQLVQKVPALWNLELIQCWDSSDVHAVLALAQARHGPLRIVWPKLSRCMVARFEEVARPQVQLVTCCVDRAFCLSTHGV